MKIIAHRGSSGNYPENTMVAFRRAWACGADGIELDIRVTLDGRLAVIHDESGRRLARVDRLIEECTMEELSRWKVGAAIPLLDDVLQALPASSSLMIELKSRAHKVLDQLSGMIGGDRPLDCSILTFNEDDAVLCAERLSRIPVFLNSMTRSDRDVEALTLFCKENGLAGLSLEWSRCVNRKNVDGLKEVGLQAAVWTVNSVRNARSAKAMGVDILMTDWPERMVGLK